MSELSKKQNNVKSILLNDSRTEERNLDHPHIENKKRHRNLFDAIEVEKKFTTGNDGSFLVEIVLIFYGQTCLPMLNLHKLKGFFTMYTPLLPTNFGLTQINQNQMSNPHQYIGNSEPCIDNNVNKILQEFEIDNEFLSDYSDIEMSPSSENRVLYPSLEIGKFVPIMLKLVNLSSLVPTNLKTHQIDLDDCPARRFPSPAISITLRLDLIRGESLLSITQHENDSQGGEGL
ncbi:hypothetical protein RYX36_000232 [Vicia faba]